MTTVLVLLYVFWTIAFIALAFIWVGYLVAERDPTTLLGTESDWQEFLFLTPRVIGILPTTAIVVACFFWPILLLIAFVSGLVFILAVLTAHAWRYYHS